MSLASSWTPDMPWVTVTVTQPGTLTVKVFGVAYDPPEHLQPLTRGLFGLLMDHLYDRFQQPFPVELIETDGARTTDIIDLSNTTPPASGDGWTYLGGTDGVYTILNGASVTVINSNTGSQRRLAVAANAKVTITLNNASITTGLGSGQSALLLNTNADVTLVLADGSTNTLTGSSGNAAIQTTNASLTINSVDKNAALNVTGINGGAGIGGSYWGAGGNITINGGTITADSNGAAGIGGGGGGAGGNITINGGTVNATGSGNPNMGGGAGVGGGSQGAGGTISIHGGAINASSSFGGSGIGGGWQAAAGVINISGGTVLATGGSSSAAGIGGGGCGSAGNSITVSGNANVTATGGDGGSFCGGGGAGIGSGGTYATTPIDAGTISITTTGTVSATGGASYSPGGSDTYTAGENIGKGGYKLVLIPTHTITASASAGGSIAPSGSVTVSDGASVTFTIAANSGYSITQVLVDGTNNAAAVTSGSYAFTNVTADHTIAATFTNSSGGTGSGSGTAADPYIITTAAQLDAARNDLGAYYKLGNDIDLSDYLCNPATSGCPATGGPGYNNGAGWNPIGNSSPGFTGNFDGARYKITGLWINRSSANYVGLFGYISANTVITNLGVEIVDAGVTGSGAVGGLVGSQNGGAITNSYVTGNVTGSTEVGGLVGYQAGNITSSYATSNVTSTVNHVGGLVGYQISGSTTDSYATGNVTYIGTGPIVYVGGLVGYHGGGSIANSYAADSINSGVPSSVGGLVGYHGGGTAITASFFDMDATGQTNGVGAGYGSVAGITGKTTPEMQTQSTFTTAGWDFTNIWTMPQPDGTGYPLLAWQAPATGGAITTVAITVTAPVTGAAPNPVAGNTVNFTAGPVNWTPAGSTFAANTQYTATVTLTAGSYYAFAQPLTSATINGQPASVSNNTGSTVTLSYTFPATTHAPTNAAPIITTPQTGATVGTSVVNVSGSADPGASVQVYVDGTPAGTPVTVAAGGNFSVTVDLGSEGTHTLTAKASVAGITGPQSNQVSITLVIGAPTIIITSPAEGASLAANTLISASVTDLTGIAQVQFLANDQLIGTSTNAPWSVTWAVTAVPDGPYTLKAIATNTAGKTAQATRTVQVQKNPAAPTAPPPPYSTQGVTATPSLSWGESPIQIQGQAIDTSGQPAPGATFTMILRVQGAERRITLQTDTSGQFNYTFYPQASDAGTYQIYVVAPGVTPAATEAPQASFTINRLTVNTSQYTLNALRGIPAAVPLQVTASPGSGATNVHWEILPADQPSGSLPPGITLDLGQPANIPAGTTAPLNVTFTGSTGTGAGGTIILTLMAQESGSAARAKLRIDYRLYDAQPGLTPNPATLQLGVQQNQRVSGAITITNKGLAPAQNVTVALQARGGGQAPAWAHLESAPAIGALDVGQSNIIQISAQPGTDVQDGYYQLELKVTASNDPGGTVPVTIAVAQAGQGGIDFKLVDIYTGTLNEQGQPIQGLQGARIVLQNDALTGTIYTATSDDQGIAHFTNLPPGNYTWRASAPNHMDAGGRTTVYANLTASERVFLDYQLISIQFSVTETTIQDVYDIVLTATFQTQVPAPVVLIEPLSVNLPDMQQGEQITGQFTVTNYGLVRADNLRIALPASDDNYGYEFFGTLPTQLQAKQRITIPYRITARQALNKSLTVNLTPQKQIEQIPGVKNQPGVQVQNAIRDFLGKGDTSGLDPSTPQAVQIRAAKAATCSSYQTQICESHDYDCAAGDNRQGASCASISRVTGSCSNEIVIPGDTVTGPRRPGGEGGGWGGGGGGGTPIGLAPSCTPPCPDCEKGGGSR